MWIRLSSVVVMLDFLLTERTETGERAPGLRSGDEALETVVMVTGEQRPPVDPGRGLVRRPARLLLLHPGDPGPPGGPRLGRRRGGVALRHGGLLQPLLAEVAHEVVLLQHRVPDEAGGRLLLLLFLLLLLLLFLFLLLFLLRVARHGVRLHLCLRPSVCDVLGFHLLTSHNNKRCSPPRTRSRSRSGPRPLLSFHWLPFKTYSVQQKKIQNMDGYASSVLTPYASGYRLLTHNMTQR
jgi:hypothetical protein